MISLMTNQQAGWLIGLALLLVMSGIVWAIKTAENIPEETKEETPVNTNEESKGIATLTDHIQSVIDNNTKQTDKLSEEEVKNLKRIKQRYNRKHLKE